MSTIPYGYWFVIGVASLLALVSAFWYFNSSGENKTSKP